MFLPDLSSDCRFRFRPWLNPGGPGDGADKLQAAGAPGAAAAGVAPAEKDTKRVHTTTHPDPQKIPLYNGIFWGSGCALVCILFVSVKDWGAYFRSLGVAQPAFGSTGEWIASCVRRAEAKGPKYGGNGGNGGSGKGKGKGKGKW